MKITIPYYRPPMLNQYIGKHWSIGHKLKSQCAEMVMAYSRHIDPAAGKRRVDIHVTLGKGAKVCDPDAYWKAVLDALARAGMLLDDNDRWCEMGKVTHDRGVPQTIITLEDLTPIETLIKMG